MFSAGYDIGSIPDQSFERDAEALVAHPFHAAMETLAAHPWPTVAAINGHCLGGGLELAVTCDLRICAEGAKLGMPPAKLGLIYGHTGLRKFLDVIGLARTKELFLTGRNVGAQRAEEIGLVNEVVADDEIEEASVKLAADIASNAPLSAKGNKHAIETLNANPVLTEEQERELVKLRESCFSSEDFREGIRAFAEKRKPEWRGR
jgi:enoyl-CoA hydratase/carnithine racemase